MQAKITLIGMYNWDNTLFDNISLYEEIDKDTVINTILWQNGEFEVLYADFGFLKSCIKHFFIQHYWTFEKIFKALKIEYEPLWNYDRTEQELINDEGTNKETNSGTDSRGISYAEGGTDSRNVSYAEGGTDTGTNNVMEGGTDGSTKEHKVSAYDSSVYTNRDKEENTNTYGKTISEANSLTHGKTESTMDSLTHGKTESTTDNLTHGHIVNGESKNDRTRSLRAFGNIGTTTSQSMLLSEFNVALYDAYKVIADLFADELCIRVF